MHKPLTGELLLTLAADTIRFKLRDGECAAGHSNFSNHFNWLGKCGSVWRQMHSGLFFFFFSKLPTRLLSAFDNHRVHDALRNLGKLPTNRNLSPSSPSQERFTSVLLCVRRQMCWEIKTTHVIWFGNSLYYRVHCVQ